MLKAESVSITRDGSTLLNDVSIEVKSGQLHALLGANGSGKTTLLRCLSGELKNECGAVKLNKQAVNRFNPKKRAQTLAVLNQQHSLKFNFTVSEVVALGRFAAIRDEHDPSEAGIIQHCLRQVDAESLANRLYPSLSGGEKARVHLARVLAQLWRNPAADAVGVFLLDEPVAALDIQHQHQTMRLLQGLAKQGFSVLVVVHDPNLALRYADEVTLLKQGRVVANGDTAKTLTPETLNATFDTQCAISSVNNIPFIVPLPG